MIDTVLVKWINEDELPDMISQDYDELYLESKILGGVRIFPYVEINEKRYYLTGSP